MKEAFVDSKGAVTIRDTEIPVPQAKQILIKVVVTGTNPKDWKYPSWTPDADPTNQGDDFAGYVEQVGAEVVGFKKGDKVGAFHEMLTPHGSYAEYALAWEHTTFHLTDKTSFEEAATFPLAVATAALGLYQELSLPLPWNRASQPTPLIVYGGATAVGAFAIKLAQLSNIHPIIAVAGKAVPFVETLVDPAKGDVVIDYREGDDAVRDKLAEAAAGKAIHHALDAVSEKGSSLNTAAALTAPAHIASVLPVKDIEFPAGIIGKMFIVKSCHSPPEIGKPIGDQEFAAAFFQFLGRALAQGWITGHPYEVRKGGLGGAQEALKDLREGKASAVKYLMRIDET